MTLRSPNHRLILASIVAYALVLAFLAFVALN